MVKQADPKGRRVLQPDPCLIGAGSAGLSVASTVASPGASVVLIEKARMGGKCLNVGCSIVEAHAGELIMPWVLAMSRGLKVSHLAGLIYPYPTFSEVTKGAAVEFLKPSAQNPWVRRLGPWSAAWDETEHET
jgi:choline dehydrogenase-like flavoprotein